jgi:hypothetical protein
VHTIAWDIAIGVLFGGVLVLAVIVAVAVIVQRRRLAGEELDEWRSIRRQLSPADRRRVTFATVRRQLVDRADLAQAQVACARMRRIAAERAPFAHNRWLRVAFPAFYGIGTLWYVVTAVTEHGSQRVLFIAVAVIFAACCVMWATVVPRSLRTQADRMARLQRRIEERYAS